MDFSKYVNDATYPTKPTRPSLDRKELDPDIIRKYADRIEYYNKQMESYNQMVNEYHRRRKEIEDQFKADALEEVGLTGHKKANKAFSAAWQKGHHAGFREIFGELEELADLILE